MMKFNAKIFYPVFVIALVAGVVIYSSLNKDNGNQQTKNPQMPNDTIHQGVNPHGANPGLANVAEAILKEMEEYRGKIRKNPNDTASIRLLGDLFAQGHKADSAIILYNQILKADPKRIDMYFALSFIYYIRGDIDKTEELTKKVLAMDKNNQQAVYNLGAIAARRGDKETAKKIWEQVMKKNPGTELEQSAKSQIEMLNQSK